VPTTTAVTRALDEAGVAYVLHVHDHPIRSLEQAARERDLRPEQILRTLVFRLEGDTFVLVLAPGPGRISWPKLRRHLGRSRITTATADEVLATTGYPPGAVSPLGLPAPLRILADDRVRSQVTVSIGAGIRNAGVVLAVRDLLRLTDPEFADFLESESA
jgi:Cys-tRNA(Pro)/Cys-tRNA(Cys) deacylase